MHSTMFGNLSTIPEWLTIGLTFLTPKNDETSEQQNYRPIRCLSTTYKLLTPVLTKSINNFLEVNNLMSVEQKGCKRATHR